MLCPCLIASYRRRQSEGELRRAFLLHIPARYDISLMPCCGSLPRNEQDPGKELNPLRHMVYAFLFGCKGNVLD